MKRTNKDWFFEKSIHRTLLDGPLQGAPRLKIPFKPTAQRPLILSTSELGDFLRCRLRWNWRYRVGLQPRAFGALRGIGIVVHIGNDQWYQMPAKKRNVTRMIKLATLASKSKDVEIIKKERELARAMLIGYSEWALDDHDYSDFAIGKYTKVFPEDQFVLPLTEDQSILVRGKIDQRFEPTIYKRTLAMDEIKTKSSISFDMMDLNHQLTTYLWAMSVKYPGYKRYLAWRTVLRRMMPGPRVKAALFGRESVERSQEELDMWLTDTRRIARDILDAAIYPTPTERCKWDCDFYNLCLVRANKKDLRDIIKSEYTTK